MMKEETIFAQLNFFRKITLGLIEKIDEEIADIIPRGFSNSIRWNLGHIYVSQENLTLRLAGLTPQIPKEFLELFEGGTKPSEWKISPPNLDELKGFLSEQPGRLNEKLQGKLDQAIVPPLSIPGFIEFRTIGETLNFSLYHEGQHTGFIKALLNEMKS